MLFGHRSYRYSTSMILYFHTGDRTHRCGDQTHRLISLDAQVVPTYSRTSPGEASRLVNVWDRPQAYLWA